MRLLHAQTLMEDDRKLCEYSLPEGTVISALFEPDVNISIKVTCGHQTQKFTVSNATSVMALKVKICGIMRCGVAPERLEIRLGDITLEDPMPLHFYGIKDDSRLDLIKPYIRVMVENNHGFTICWRLNKKDTISEVKVKLATATKRPGKDERLVDPNDSVKVEQLHLYVVIEGQNFAELDDDDKTVENFKIKENYHLSLLTYRLTYKHSVMVMKTGIALWGVDPDDTCLGIKVKVQDQMGLPVNTLNVFRERYNNNEMRHDFCEGYPLKGFSDEEKPFISYSDHLIVITDDGLQTEAPRIAEEWRGEQERKTQEEQPELESLIFD